MRKRSPKPVRRSPERPAKSSQNADTRRPRREVFRTGGYANRGALGLDGCEEQAVGVRAFLGGPGGSPFFDPDIATIAGQLSTWAGTVRMHLSRRVTAQRREVMAASTTEVGQ
jgi:hypothetical protein